MPNTFAFIMLATWPVLAMALYLRLGDNRPRAVIWVTLAGFLLLPSKIGVSLPGVPELDKAALSGLALGIITLLFRPRDGRSRWIGPVVVVLMIMILLGPIGTALTNGDYLFFASTILNIMTMYDAASAGARSLLVIVLVFLAGFSFFRTLDELREILVAIVWAGLAYSILILIEVRLSPQIHATVYGFFPHKFAQQIRGSGFRPVVFLQHGLWVAFFAFTFTVSAVALWRQSQQDAGLKTRLKPYFLPISGYFFVILYLCKSLASLLYGIILTPIIAFAKPKTQIYFAACLVVISLSYPTLRAFEVIPLDTLVDIATDINADRAQSLQFRFANDQALLDRALERSTWGWGTWGRSLIYDEDFGYRISTLDGYWIGVLGSWGVVGFVGLFGLLAWPVLLIARHVWSGALEANPVLGGLCLIQGVNMIELLPNSTSPPTLFLITGALYAYARQARRVAVDEQPALAARRRTVL